MKLLFKLRILRKNLKYIDDINEHDEFQTVIHTYICNSNDGEKVDPYDDNSIGSSHIPTIHVEIQTKEMHIHAGM